MDSISTQLVGSTDRACVPQHHIETIGFGGGAVVDGMREEGDSSSSYRGRGVSMNGFEAATATPVQKVANAGFSVVSRVADGCMVTPQSSVTACPSTAGG